jgi:hypothetical protein
MNKRVSVSLGALVLAGAGLSASLVACSNHSSQHATPAKTAHVSHQPAKSPASSPPAMEDDPKNDVHDIRLTSSQDDDGVYWLVVDFKVTNRGAVPHDFTMTYALYGKDPNTRAGTLSCSVENVQPGETVPRAEDTCATDSDAYDAPAHIREIKTVKLIDVEVL